MGSFLLLLVVALNLVLLVLGIALWRRGSGSSHAAELAQVARESASLRESLSQSFASATADMATRLESTKGDLRQEVKRTVAQGDLVAVHSRYVPTAADRERGAGVAAVDIFRVEHGKIVEHWDVLQDIPEKPANDNSMF